jgi:HlyD family secretion protein
MSADPKPVSAQRSIRRHLVAGLAAVFVLTGGLGGWAATTEIAGAVVTSGFLVVESDVKKVQHPTGGVVGELNVKDGDDVQAGQVLIRLDDTQTRANLAIIEKSLDELAARQARDEAERDGVNSVVFPPDLLARSDDPVVARLTKGEERLFVTRHQGREGRKSQLNEQIAQMQEQIRGIEAQEDAKTKEIEWNAKELEGVRGLWEKNLVQFGRLTELERDTARLQGERGQLIAAAAQAKGKITEIQMQILQVDQDLATDVGKELADIRAKTSELGEKRVAAQDMLKRIEIRAPQTGKVHELSVHTVGGVISPGEPIMLIVPDADALTVEVRVSPQDIDQISVGQAAGLRFTAFNQRSTPELTGQVLRVSADVVVDPKTGVSFFTARIAVLPEEIAKLGSVRLVPGMPVEAFIRTNERTVLSYLVRPLYDQMMKAFRDS